MKFTLKQLQLFVNTAKYQSISKGAEACHITQAAASIALGQLEQALGAPLFDRVGKRLRLNCVGRDLLGQATAIVDRANAMQQFQEQTQAALTGSITIGASTTIANYVLPQKLARFKQQYANINIDVEIANTSSIIEKVLAFDVDFAYIEGFCKHPQIELTVWQQDQLEIICRNGHLLTQKKHLTRKDLKKYAWVMREPGSGTRAVFDNALCADELGGVEITLNSTEAIASYVCNSDCLGYVSSSYFMDAMRGQGLVRLKVAQLDLQRNFYMLMHESKYQSKQSLLLQDDLSH